VYGTVPIGQTALQYADPSTWVGPDPDPTFDADDELVFMAADAGEQAPANTPPPAGASSGLHLSLTDPVTGNVGHVYLFATDGSIDQAAGVNYVDYRFSLAAGDYLTDYKRADGPNPELSGVATPAYLLGFSDRWFHTSLELTSGTGGDVLDGQKHRFNFSACGRSNTTFADAEGAFVANIDGPVRAVRSYIGANSGPLTQQTVIMYRDRFDIVTDLRVHPIPGVLDLMDWSFGPGTVYGSSNLTGPELLNGWLQADPGTSLPTWEYVAGPQGVVTMAAQLNTDAAGLTVEGVLLDRPVFPTECWGDGTYQASGINVASTIPNTDPLIGAANTLQFHRVMAIWPDDVDPEPTASSWAPTVFAPLVVKASAY
jgi:hypothetical protein